jgi:penicillin amidase
VLYDVLPQPLAEFLNPPGTEWDAPIAGDGVRTPAIPGPETYDLRTRTAFERPGVRSEAVATPPAGGSNNWAVAGDHTEGGIAIVANDMHLGLGLPNVWYRVALVVEGEARRRLVGVTLPGVPALVVGSNGAVAWSFTNSYGDWADLIELEQPPGDEGSYLTAEGPVPFARHEERIQVRGEEAVVVEVLETVWGPVIDEDHRGRRRALRWIAHHPRAANPELVDLELAGSVEQALDVAARAGLPAQNFVAGDRDGRIGWTIAGPIPERMPPPPTKPVSWRSAGRWERWLSAEAYPRIVSPSSGRIWTANNRVVGPPMLDAIGDGGFALGARATKIRDGLLAESPVDERDMLAIQLDDGATLMERWRSLLLELLDPQALAADPRRAELRRLVEQDWSGHASVDSAGYRMVRGFRTFLADAVFGAITAPCTEADERFRFGRTTQQSEGPLWRLVQERPLHLLPPDFESWREQLLAAVDELLDYYERTFDTELAELTWGKRNTVQLAHPISRAVPQLSRWLDLPPVELPGDSYVPRVQGPGFGASERLVVAPGREETGLFHMPGGQSGHPLSPFYSRGYLDWVEGNPSPLLPGPTAHELILRPATDAGN